MTLDARRGSGALAGTIAMFVSGIVHAAPIVHADVLSLGGGVYHYDFTVLNNTGDDLAIVSLTDAPLGDPLIGPSLTSPAGFLASYDGGLGFVDFIESTSPFPVSATTGPFGFDSLSPPGPGRFSAFEALTVNGDLFTGSVSIDFQDAVVPEPGTLGLLALGIAGLSLRAGKLARRRGEKASSSGGGEGN